VCDRFERATAAAGSEHPFQFIVTQMHRALQLNSRMERMVGDLMAGARLSAGSFGCVHARVESDIYEMARVAGGPSRRESIMPSKDDYVAWARQLAHTSAAENNGSYPV
jgi:hypothetical protein